MIANPNDGNSPRVEVATPMIDVSAGGLITATTEQEKGYVSGGTKSATQQLTTQGAKTVTPTTTAQTAVASGRYTTGAVQVAGDANLVPENIAEGVSIFGVDGTHSGGGGELVNVQLVAQHGYTNVDEGDPNMFWVYAQTEPGVYEEFRFNLGEVQNIQVVKNSTILGSVTSPFPSQVSGNAQILYDVRLQSMPGYDSYPILVYGDCGIVF